MKGVYAALTGLVAILLDHPAVSDSVVIGVSPKWALCTFASVPY